jgi:hypothetical protein
VIYPCVATSVHFCCTVFIVRGCDAVTASPCSDTIAPKSQRVAAGAVRGERAEDEFDAA